MTPAFGDFVAATLFIAVGFAVSAVFYTSLSQPDAVTPRLRRLVGRWLGESPWRPLVELVVEIVAITVLVVFWVTVVDVTLFFLLPVERVQDTLLLPYAIVAANRILAFFASTAARELAKTVPLALVVLLLIGQPLSVDSIVAKATSLEGAVPDDGSFMLAVVILEIVLRSSRAVFRRQEPAA